MERKQTIKSNEELYGDYELIPLDLDAVQQRINFFDYKVSDLMAREKYLKEHYEPAVMNDCIKHRAFWQGIKEEHCTKETE